MDGTILIADDDRTIRTVLTQAYTRAGCKVHATSSLQTLMGWVNEGRGDLVITDVMMPDGNGLDTLPEITAARPDLPVIVISAQNTIVTAIKAAEVEAFDYLPKPFDLPDLMSRSARALTIKQKTMRPDLSKPKVAQLPLIGRSVVMQELYQLIAKVVNSDLSVLVLGESGAGKSLLTRAIHDLSVRADTPFITVSAHDLGQPNAYENLLRRVGQGTLVFDEVADLSLVKQEQLVRFIDCMPQKPPRISATTQTNLIDKMEKGDFRKDLYYRLNGVSLIVPSLRDRIDDIDLLVEHFIPESNNKTQTKPHLSADAINLLQSYSWPGNIRQLENSIKRLVMTSTHPEISMAEVERVLRDQPATESLDRDQTEYKLSGSVARHIQRYFDLHGGELPPVGLYHRILKEIEKPLIEIALESTAGNQAKCADLLGLNRNTLRKKINDLDIHVTRRRKMM